MLIQPITKTNFISGKCLNQAKVKNISFGDGPGMAQSALRTTTYYPDYEKLNILGRTKSQLKDLAEYFHKSSQSEIEWYCGKEKFFLSKSIFKKRVAVLTAAIAPVVANRLAMEKRISELQGKKTVGAATVSDHQERLTSLFTNLVKAEKSRIKDVPITNGILIHGESKNKKEITNWLANTSGATYKKICFDKYNPLSTIQKIVDISENAEASFKHSGQRTLLEVENLDEMLTNKSSRDGILMIGRFKGLAERLSKDYHTTLLMTTEKPLEQFEAASIAPHRFGIQLEMKNGLTGSEENELKTLQKEVARLDEKAENLNNEFRKINWFAS